MVSNEAIIKLMDRVETLTRQTAAGANLEYLIEGDAPMKEIRLRVIVGKNEDGSPIIRRVGAYDELALADKVIKAVVESGRIAEFLPAPVAGTRWNPNPETPKEPAKHPFDSYIDHWLSTYKIGLEKTTDVFYSSKRNVLVRFFGSMPVEDIDVETVQKFLNERAAKYVRATVDADLGVLRDLLDVAVRDKLLEANPATDKRIKNPAKRGKGTTAFTLEQFSAIQAGIPALADPVQRCLLGLLAYSSMCREELLGLKWENINLDTDIITIDAAVVYAGGTVAKGTKNEFRTRPFPICPALHDILAGCKRDSGYVIHGPDPEEPISSYYYRRLWRDTAKNIELYGLTAKSFRTTFATFANAAGVDDKTIASLMGHSNTNTAKIHYIKQEQTALNGAMGKLGAFVSASSNS